MLYAGLPILVLGLIMMLRGWIYTLRPNGRIAERRKRRNLKVGFTTDMKLFGRKIRRLGLMIALAGGGLVGWHLSRGHDVPVAPSAPAPSAPSAPSAPAPSAPSAAAAPAATPVPAPGTPAP